MIQMNHTYSFLIKRPKLDAPIYLVQYACVVVRVNLDVILNTKSIQFIEAIGQFFNCSVTGDELSSLCIEKFLDCYKQVICNFSCWFVAEQPNAVYFEHEQTGRCQHLSY